MWAGVALPILNRAHTLGHRSSLPRCSQAPPAPPEWRRGPQPLPEPAFQPQGLHTDPALSQASLQRQLLLRAEAPLHLAWKGRVRVGVTRPSAFTGAAQG